MLGLPNYARNLLFLRKLFGLSQIQVGEICESPRSKQQVGKWERGDAELDFQNLIKLSRHYKVTIDELLTGELWLLTDDEIRKKWSERLELLAA